MGAFWSKSTFVFIKLRKFSLWFTLSAFTALLLPLITSPVLVAGFLFQVQALLFHFIPEKGKIHVIFMFLFDYGIFIPNVWHRYTFGFRFRFFLIRYCSNSDSGSEPSPSSSSEDGSLFKTPNCLKHTAFNLDTTTASSSSSLYLRSISLLKSSTITRCQDFSEGKCRFKWTSLLKSLKTMATSKFFKW